MSIQRERVVVRHGVERVVTVRQAGRTVEVRQLVSPRVSVVSVGVQGPVGVLAEGVLQRTLQAEAAARQATAVAAEASDVLEDLLTDLRAAFQHHAGAISAQERG